MPRTNSLEFSILSVLLAKELMRYTLLYRYTVFATNHIAHIS